MFFVLISGCMILSVAAQDERAPATVDQARQINAEAARLIDAGRFAEAEPPARRALAIYRELLGTHVDTSHSLHNLALSLANTARYAEAEPLAREALAMRRATLGEASADTSHSLHILGWILIELGQHDEAEQHTSAALTLRRELFGEVSEAASWSLNNLATIESWRGHHKRAEHMYREVLAIRQQLYDKPNASMAHCQANIALMLATQGRFTEARSFYELALATDLELLGPDHAEVGRRKCDLGDVLRSQGLYGAAEPLLLDALDIRRRALGPDHPQVARSLIALAMQRLNQADPREAERLARRALAIDRAARPDAHFWVAHDLHILAWALRDQGDYVRSEALFRKALALYEEVAPTNHPNIPALLSLLGPMYDAIGDDVRAERALRLGLDMRRACMGAGHWCVAEDSQRLGAFLCARGDCREAEQLLAEVLQQQCDLIGGAHPDVGLTVLELAIAERRLGRLEDALTHARRAVAIFTAALGAEHPTTATATLETATILSVQGATSAATELFERGVGALRTAGDPHLHGACTRFADHLSACGTNPRRALALYEEAIDEIEHRRQRVGGDELDRARYFSELARLDPYGGAVRLTLANGNRAAEALSLSERGRGRALLDLLNRDNHGVESLLQARATSEPAIAHALGDIERRQSAARARAAMSRHRLHVVLRDEDIADDVRRSMKDHAIAEHSQAEQDLRQASREMFDLARDHLVSRGVVPLAAGDIVSHLEPDEVMLIYDIGAHDSLLWHVRGGMGPENGIAVHHLKWPDGSAVTTPTLAPVLSDVVDAIERRACESAHVQTLRGALLPDSVRQVLRSASLMVVVPDGPLHGLPFEVLADHADVDRAEPPVVYVPSATVFINRRQRTQRRGAAGDRLLLVALGDPQFGPSCAADDDYVARALSSAAVERTRETWGVLAPLPGTRSEVEAIAALARRHGSANRVHCLLGPAATRSAVSAFSEHPRYLHLATHGLIGHTPGGFDSALMLSAEAYDDGMLRLDDLLNHWAGKLDGTEMVTLSACRTAHGPLETHDGFVALTWGFLYAGADSVLATLWPVNDVSTVILMEDVYRGILDDGLSRSAALHRAKRKLRTMSRRVVEQRLSAMGLTTDSITRSSRAGPPVAQRPTDRPFEHPYYWAPFVLVGAN